MSSFSPEKFATLAPDAPFWGFMGAAFALVFSNFGAAYGTGKSGMGISSLGVGKPELVMKSIVPVRAARGSGGLSRPPRGVPRARAKLSVGLPPHAR